MKNIGKDCMGQCPHRPETDGRDNFTETGTPNGCASGAMCRNRPYEYLRSVHSCNRRERKTKTLVKVPHFCYNFRCFWHIAQLLCTG